MSITASIKIDLTQPVAMGFLISESWLIVPNLSTKFTAVFQNLQSKINNQF